MIGQLLHRATAILLIFALSANNINTIVIVTDFIINQDFIAKTLCIQKEEQKGCNGKCQLRKELSENNTSKDSENPIQNSERNRLDVFIVMDFSKDLQMPIVVLDKRKKLVISHQSLPVSPFYDIDTPPPNLS
ncbi:hypothetical protein [Psychroserpens sp.]|uniref:hypothetical protein n=1 Tax=Psychroserpens sp. TaxID=2020870 RepID=UPI001B2008C1|nr:hypothetical protein [Psychroserpens sp.]MBO6607398.1 hypothetical protein [Psychroserpens sp.]MBO6632355.1 hypothetical protein [Psychroserpens sp.]MBO6654524.1 hypothetical protein [Psychroserpens sp.]MBO6681127.1 hypothetical protein [Psychroserpens sp.]MBO6749916.1 hypothetical protein [Psychroserpens sp.]